MKKNFVSLISVILIIVLLVACGNGTTSSSIENILSGEINSNTSNNIYSNIDSSESFNYNSEINSSGINSTDILSSDFSSINTSNNINNNQSNQIISNPNITSDYHIDSEIQPPIVEGADDTPAPKTTVVGGRNYKLTFEDNFTGDELDMSKWRYSTEGPRNCGRWDSDTVSVQDGVACFLAMMDDDDVPISGSIESVYTQTRGYFEARILLPEPPKCYWGAFWMMCGAMSSVKNGAVDGVEIDIMESIPNKSYTIQHNLHWDGYLADHKQVGAIYRGQNMYLYNGWHTYSVEWTDNEYIFYIDGIETYRTNPNKSSDPKSCINPGYMQLSIEFSNDITTVVPSHMPSYMFVDWVRVYQNIN